MCKVTVFKEVAIAEWRYDRETKTKYADGYMVFEKELALPFAPTVGLQFQQEGWLPGPLTQVRFNVDSQEFVCFVQEDNEIPEKLDTISQDETKTEDDIEKFLHDEVRFKKSLYRDFGWRLREATK